MIISVAMSAVAIVVAASPSVGMQSLDDNVRHTGTVKMWMKDQNYGFIADDNGRGDFRVHRSVLHGCANLQHGEKIGYTAGVDSTGLNVATLVWLLHQTVMERDEAATRIAKAWFRSYRDGE
jgi:cold shock CspA family protein